MKKILSHLFVLLLLTSCSKEKQENEILPPATREGKNTFGFLLNDEVWVKKNEVTLYPVLTAGYVENFGFSISCRRSKNDDFAGLVFKTIDKGTRPFNSQNGDVIDITVDSSGGTKTYTLIDGGELKITRFDKEKRIVSGEFSAQILERSTGEKLSITQGRFDFTF